MLQRMHTFNPEDAGVDLRLTRKLRVGRRDPACHCRLHLVSPRLPRTSSDDRTDSPAQLLSGLLASQGLCNRLLSPNPDDAEVLALKAEVLHWAGDRRFLARRTADRAAEVAPAYPDAQVAQVYPSLDLGQNRTVHVTSQCHEFVRGPSRRGHRGNDLPRCITFGSALPGRAFDAGRNFTVRVLQFLY